MNKGSKSDEWTKFARQWKKDNPPLDNGCYVCGICGYFVVAEEVTLDHITPRSNKPSEVFAEGNIQPAHSSCNSWKGSRHIRPKVSPEQYRFLAEVSLF